MRITAAILACLGTGALSVALADPPASAPAAPTATAATSAAAAPAAPPAPDALEKHFLSEGYHVEMRHGDKVYCRYEAEIGSRVNRQKLCGSLVELKSAEEQAQAGQQQAARMQQNRPVN